MKFNHRITLALLLKLLTASADTTDKPDAISEDARAQAVGENIPIEVDKMEHHEKKTLNLSNSTITMVMQQQIKAVEEFDPWLDDYPKKNKVVHPGVPNGHALDCRPENPHQNAEPADTNLFELILGEIDAKTRLLELCESPVVDSGGKCKRMFCKSSEADIHPRYSAAVYLCNNGTKDIKKTCRSVRPALLNDISGVSL